MSTLRLISETLEDVLDDRTFRSTSRLFSTGWLSRDSELFQACHSEPTHTVCRESQSKTSRLSYDCPKRLSNKRAQIIRACDGRRHVLSGTFNRCSRNEAPRTPCLVIVTVIERSPDSDYSFIPGLIKFRAKGAQSWRHKIFSRRGCYSQEVLRSMRLAAS